MIILITLISGCLGWLVAFMGWWIPVPNLPLVISVGLGIFLMAELTFLRKRNVLTWMALLSYANIALAGWVNRFWQENDYFGSPIFIMRFFSIVALMMSAILVVAFIKGKSGGEKNRYKKDDRTFKSIFERNKKDAGENMKEVSIVLGESANEKQNSN